MRHFGQGVITILNGKYHQMCDAVEYIGRPSPLGNPFKIGPDGTREQVIDRYRDWLLVALSNPDSSLYKGVNKEYKRLYRKYYDEGALTLMCWCSPLPCHGDVIADLIEEKVAGV